MVHRASPYGSTKFQAPAFAEAASRRQAKSQINPNHPNSKQNLFGHLKFDFGAYLGFGICNLGFAAGHAFCGLHPHQLLLLEFYLIEGINIGLGTGDDDICVSSLADHGLAFLLQFNSDFSLGLCPARNGIDCEL